MESTRMNWSTKKEIREKLEEIAEAQRRTPTKQLDYLVEEAYEKYKLTKQNET